MNHAGKRASAGFTLIELLVVLGIIGLLSTLAGPSLVAVFQGSALTQSGQMVQDQLTYYRQYALANNVTVEVRFYTFSDPLVPNDKAHYRALQAFTVAKPQLQTDGTFLYTKTPLTKAQKLPASIIMDSGTSGGSSSLSGLIYYATSNSGTIWNNLGSTSSGLQSPGSNDPPLLNVGVQYQYIAYQIRPDGSTNLPYGTDGNWSFYVTLHPLSNGDGLAAVPKNYYTVQIDPIDGHIFFYRP